MGMAPSPTIEVPRNASRVLLVGGAALVLLPKAMALGSS